jgi:hypothetical protein
MHLRASARRRAFYSTVAMAMTEAGGVPAEVAPEGPAPTHATSPDSGRRTEGDVIAGALPA